MQAERERLLAPMIARFPTSDWMKNDPLLRRWAQEEAAAKSSETSKIAPSIQAKLTVSTPGDKYEQEADAMAAKVMAMPDRAIEPFAPKQSNHTTTGLQRAVNEDKTVSPELENRIHNATGGSPLPEEVRSFMEERFGVDFSAIRVHTDSAAAQMCKEVGAKAFAVGNRIYYGAGYAPGKNELTAHELTHTIQQGAAKTFNRQVKPLPEPQETLVAKKINISPPHNNRQVYKFPLEEAAPQPQKVEPTFNKISRQIVVEKLPESILPAKQFTNKAEPNFNKIQTLSADRLSQTESPEAKSYLSLKTEGFQARSINQTKPQVQRNVVRDLTTQAAIKTLETFLPRFGPVGVQVLGILRSARNAFGTIARRPEVFLANLRKAVEAGFKGFATRIGTHLQNGLIAWLTGALGSSGVSVPQKLDARGIVTLVLQVLGINYSRVRGMLVKRIGETKVKQFETGFGLVQRIASNGLPSAIQHMMHLAKSLETLQKTVVEGIRNWVIETVVRQAVAQVLATFTGLGAVANIIQAIYRTFSFIIEQASQIQALVNAVKSSIGNIAAGQIGTAASFIEKALAGSLSVVINFLARQVGLGNVGQKVREIIQQVRSRVDAAVNKLIDRVINEGNSWLAASGRGRANNRQPKPNNRPKPQPATTNRQGQNNQKPAQNQRSKPQQATTNRQGQNNQKPTPNQRPKPQPATPNRQGQNNQKPAPNQRSKPQPATPNRQGQNNQKPAPKLTPAEIRQHEQMASEAVRQLENTNGRLKDYNTTRAEKIAQARRMKPGYDRRLKSPIKFNVHFESNIAKDKADSDLDFKVVIAPNNTTQTGSVPTTQEPNLPTTQVTHIPQGNKAGFVKAEPLTNLQGTNKDSQGSRPGAVLGWNHVLKIDRVQLSKNPPRYGPIHWVKMHLLSERLHGPGKYWNLVPARRSDNTYMEQGPEAEAKQRTANNEVLYYEVEVTYHSGKTVEDFPATIEVKWGSMKQQGKSFVRNQQLGHFRLEPEAPSLEALTKVDLRNAGWKTLNNLGIKERVAKNIEAERMSYNPPRPFKDEADFKQRMQAWYANMRRPVNFQETYWESIENLIKNGEAGFGGESIQ
jgi:hypothetical protein